MSEICLLLFRCHAPTTISTQRLITISLGALHCGFTCSHCIAESITYALPRSPSLWFAYHLGYPVTSARYPHVSLHLFSWAPYLRRLVSVPADYCQGKKGPPYTRWVACTTHYSSLGIMLIIYHRRELLGRLCPNTVILFLDIQLIWFDLIDFFLDIQLIRVCTYIILNNPIIYWVSWTKL